MKTLFVIFSVLLVNTGFASVNYSSTAFLPMSARNIVISNSEFAYVATKTEVRPIPGCDSYGESGINCDQTVVLESEAVVRVDISFDDNQFSSDQSQGGYVELYFKLSDFSEDQIDLLKSVYPSWKHPFSNVSRNFARDHFSFTVQDVKQPIQVVDMKKSKLCPIDMESGAKLNPFCQDQLVYKDSWTTVKLVTVSKK